MESFIDKSPNDHICLVQDNKIKCKRFTKMLFTKNMVCEAQSTDLDGYFFTTKESLNNQSVNDNNVVTECLHLPQKIDSSFLMKMTKSFFRLFYILHKFLKRKSLIVDVNLLARNASLQTASQLK